MNKKIDGNDLIFYFGVTAINLIVYSIPWITNRMIGAPFLWVILILLPSLVGCMIYEYRIKEVNNRSIEKID